MRLAYRIHRLALIGALLVACLLSSVVAQEAVRETVTPTGLRIWSFPDDGGDRFVMMVLVGAGARHEEDSHTGLAHLLEHVLLGSTQEWSRAESRRLLDEASATENGYTNHDVTTYFLSCPADSWSLAVEWLAEHLVDPAFHEEDLQIERSIVFEELDSNEPHAGSASYGSFLYEGHALGRSIGGDKRGIEDFELEDLKEFYKDFYQARNMAVGFAGKVPYKACVEQITSAFEGLGTLGELALIDEVVPFTGEFRLPEDPGGSAWSYSGYHLPTSNAKDTAAQILIAEYLDLRGFQVIREERQLSYAPQFSLRFFSDTTRLSLAVDASSREGLSEIMSIEETLYSELANPIEATFESAVRRSAGHLEVNNAEELGEVMELAWLMRRAGDSPMDLQRELAGARPQDLATYAAAHLVSENRFSIANAPLGVTSAWVLAFIGVALFFFLDGLRGFAWSLVVRRKWVAWRSSRSRRKNAVVPLGGDDLEKRFQAFFEEEDSGR